MTNTEVVNPPIVRTKCNRLPQFLDRTYHQFVLELFDGEITPDTYLEKCLKLFQDRKVKAYLSSLEEEVLIGEKQSELLRRHIDQCRYTVLLYRVDENEVHPPHHHFNVISTQIVLRGQLRLREYERVRRDRDGALILELVTDQIVKEGDSFQASEWRRNVHWFQAIGGPALIFNTNARGFERETFDSRSAGFGRRYVDPTRFISECEVRAEEFSQEEADLRFAGKPLDNFPIGVVGR